VRFVEYNIVYVEFDLQAADESQQSHVNAISRLEIVSTTRRRTSMKQSNVEVSLTINLNTFVLYLQLYRKKLLTAYLNFYNPKL